MSKKRAVKKTSKTSSSHRANKSLLAESSGLAEASFTRTTSRSTKPATQKSRAAAAIKSLPKSSRTTANSPQFALITGATSGIGEATALALANSGWNLILTGRRKDRLDTLTKKLTAQYPQQKFLAGIFDIQKRKDIEAFAKKFDQDLARVELLINNAGLAKGTQKIHEGDLDDWDAMIDTNIKGLLHLSRLVLPHMVKKSAGHIVNIGSVAGRWTYPGGAVYCATKFAVRAISEGLRMDLLGKDIRISNVEPGMVETEFSKVRFNDEDKAKAVYAGMKPLTAADIAETILWIVERPKHVNIQELVIFPTDQASIRDVHRTS